MQITVNDPAHQPPTTVVINGAVCVLYGPDHEALCVWCMEPIGVCRFTGGLGLPDCDGAVDAAAALLQVDRAPTIHPPLRV